MDNLEVDTGNATCLDCREQDQGDRPSDVGQQDNAQTTKNRFPNHPIQLVRPDPLGHKKLELIAENVRHLHYITSSVAVVAVVGKFHSGKSFLLNQLMGKSDAFSIGPTVHPQTMGIWMWGEVSGRG